MTTSRSRRRAAAVALSVTAVLVPASATEAAPSPAGAPAHAAPAAALAAAPTCPVVADKLLAAADRRVRVERITPKPSWRVSCGQLYRSDSRAPEVIFKEGFQPKATLDGQYDIEKYVLNNQPSPYVSTSYDHDLYKQWKSGFNYYIDAPAGVDVNKTIGDTHKYASQKEVAFPGGIASKYVVGACPVDTVKKTEDMSECVDNPNYVPWRH